MIIGGNAIGDVERRCPLVGGDDEIRIVAIAANDSRRRRDTATQQVVGDIQQAANERSIAGDAFGLPGLAVGRTGRALDDKAALRPNRHDHRVFDHLRLHQAEHFCAKILPPVRPANAAAGDLAAAQVDAFDARAVDEDFDHRPR